MFLKMKWWQIFLGEGKRKKMKHVSSGGGIRPKNIHAKFGFGEVGFRFPLIISILWYCQTLSAQEIGHFIIQHFFDDKIVKWQRFKTVQILYLLPFGKIQADTGIYQVLFFDIF